MKIIIPNYPKLFLNFLIQTFRFKAFLAIILLPFALTIVFDKNAKVWFFVTNFLQNFLQKIMEFYQYSNVPESVLPYLMYSTYSILIYLLCIFPFFVLIEIFYFKHRIKGLSTQEIKNIFAKREALKEIEKEKNRY